MFLIALCDNDETELLKLKQAVEQWQQKHPDKMVRTDLYYSGADLARRLEQDASYDLYLLDIIMPEPSGIRLGHLIRERSPLAQLIYVTSSPDFALDAFGAQALDYLLKPVDTNKLHQALDRAWALCCGQQSRYISIKSRQGLRSIDSASIVYIEIVSRSPVYHLYDGEIIQGLTIRSSFDDAIAPLDHDPSFISPHKSFYVNMRFVCGIRNRQLLLEGGGSIPVSHPKLGEVNRLYLKYLSNGGMRSI